MSDWLQEAGEAAMTGTAMKQAELTNLTFLIKSVTLHDFTDQRGNPAQSYVGTIRVDGQNEDVEAWLGGIRVMAQVKEIIKREALPIRVKQTSVASGKGSAYNLEFVGGAKAGKAALADYMKANQLKANEVLEAIGEKVTGDVRECWSRAIEKIIGLHNTDEDGACALILERLESQTVPSEDIPFE